MIKEILEKTDKELRKSKDVAKSAIEVQKEVRKHIITAISAAFAFIMALFWRDAIQSGIDSFLASVGLTGDAYIYKIIVAVVVTIICVIGIVILARMEKKEPETT